MCVIDTIPNHSCLFVIISVVFTDNNSVVISVCAVAVLHNVCLFILQMDVLNKFIKQLIASEDNNFKSAGENLDTVVTGNVST